MSGMNRSFYFSRAEDRPLVFVYRAEDDARLATIPAYLFDALVYSPQLLDALGHAIYRAFSSGSVAGVSKGREEARAVMREALGL